MQGIRDDAHWRSQQIEVAEVDDRLSMLSASNADFVLPAAPFPIACPRIDIHIDRERESSEGDVWEAEKEREKETA